jgi:hypothetical protein
MEELDDLCQVINENCSDFSPVIRGLHLALACLVIVQTALAYLVRDAMLMGSNYKEGKEIGLYEEVTGVVSEIMTETRRSYSVAANCPNCKSEELESGPVIKFFEDNRCAICGEKVKKGYKIDVVKRWLASDTEGDSHLHPKSF